MSDTDNLEQKDPLNNPEPIDFDAIEKGSDYDLIFQDLQGGIIKSYGRKYALYIFINFDREKVGAIEQWIATEIATNVTSTSVQLDDTKNFKEEIELRKQQKLDPALYYGKMCKNFFLSAHGYRILLGDERVKEVSDRLDPLFTAGMKADWETNYRLDRDVDEAWYNPPERWDIGKSQDSSVGNYPIDASIALAHDSLEELKEAATRTIDNCKEFTKIVGCEVGYQLKDPNGNCVGPFGFVDGISQPLFLKNDYEKYGNSHDLKIWNPKASLALVLQQDPFGEKYSYGSYCVWQKLETNLQLFEQKVDELAKQLEGDRERAGALTIGRYKDGTPLANSEQLNQNERDSNNNKNDFNYANDLTGSRCPLHAHVRKVNPRKDDPDLEESRRTKNRIFRAGITYFDDPLPQQETDILQLCLKKLAYLDRITELDRQSLADKNISGLLFVCFQSSISEQFSRLQQKWADDAEFPREREEGKDRYLDPIIGHPLNRNHQEYPIAQEWPKEENGEQFSAYPFYGCVALKGGEFFFAPSISFLKNLQIT